MARDVARGSRGGVTPLLRGAQREGHVCRVGAPARHDGEGAADAEGDLVQPGGVKLLKSSPVHFGRQSQNLLVRSVLCYCAFPANVKPQTVAF